MPEVEPLRFPSREGGPNLQGWTEIKYFVLKIKKKNGIAYEDN